VLVARVVFEVVCAVRHAANFMVNR
jgi:hypothetical protein